MSTQASFADGGVVDMHNQIVIPLNYTRIESVGNQFHAQRERITGINKGRTSNIESKIFDKDGRQSSLSSTTPPPVSKDAKGIPSGYRLETTLSDGCIVSADLANGGKLGYIDGNGQVRLPFEFKTLRYVGESRFFAGNPDQAGIWHYFLYDALGHLIAKFPDFVQNYSSAYNEGFLLVGDDTGRAFVDLGGKIVIPPSNYRYESPVYQGMANFLLKHNGEVSCGYVNVQNKLVCGPFKDCRADPFYRGLGNITKIQADGTVKLGAVDKNGRLVFPIEFEPFDYIGSRFILGGRNGKFELFLRTGEVHATLPAGTVAAWAYDFDKNDIVPFNIGGVPPSPGMNGNTAFGGKWGYCDEHGNVVIEPMFKFAGLFTGKFATACIEDKHGNTKTGLIDKKGHWQLPPSYASVQMAGPDRAIVYSDGTSGIVEAFHDPKQRNLGLFQKVLKYYDLIGMSESELDSVLGKGDVLSDQEPEVPTAIRKRINYDFFPLYIDAKPTLSVEFGVNENGKVWAWRFREPNGSWDWNSKNQLLENFEPTLTGKSLVLKPAP